MDDEFDVNRPWTEEERESGDTPRLRWFMVRRDREGKD